MKAIIWVNHVIGIAMMLLCYFTESDRQALAFILGLAIYIFTRGVIAVIEAIEKKK